MALNTERVASQAHALLSSRIDSVRDLVAAEQAVRTAEDAHRAAWRSATDQGWGESELRKLGLTKPVFPRAKRSPRRNDATDLDPAATDAGQDSAQLEGVATEA